MKKLSGLVFIIPLITAIVWNIEVHVFILLIVIILSIAHRVKRWKPLTTLDIAFALLLIVSNLMLIFIGKTASLTALVAFIFIFPALYFYVKRNQSPKYVLLWHLSSAIITLFSQLTFIS